MRDTKSTRPSGRHCFVTIGATAGFSALLTAILSAPFISFLQKYGFTSLLIQYGHDKDTYERLLPSVLSRNQLSSSSSMSTSSPPPLSISGISFAPSLASHMLACRATPSRPTGLVICHGGAGTILELLRLPDVPFVAVPNPTLMNDHQTELVAHVAQERPSRCVHGGIGSLNGAVVRAVEMAWQMDDAPPYEKPPPFPPIREKLALFDWVAMSCYPERMAIEVQRVGVDGASKK